MQDSFDSDSEYTIQIHPEKDFDGMRRAGHLAAEVLDFITPYVKPGVTTGELDMLCDQYTRDHGAISACMGYKGYPKSTCISPNHIVCHGIPGDKKLLDGDIINIDVTVILDGWYGDTSRMYLVGDHVSIKARRLVAVTYESLVRGIDAAAKPSATLGDVGYAIQSYAEGEGFSVVRDFCGHGLGRVFHTAPSVLHFGNPGEGIKLRPGMFLTIEPMINAGKYGVKVLNDGWTAVTKDRSLSAQFEHSLAITENGVEIFTLSPNGYTQPPYVLS